MEKIKGASQGSSLGHLGQTPLEEGPGQDRGEAQAHLEHGGQGRRSLRARRHLDVPT